jgi:LacI family transcriptional regulator
MAVLEVAIEEEIAIPDDLALLGVDDDWLHLNMLSVPLSSIRLNGERIGYRAAELLCEALAGKVKFPAKEKIAPLRVVERTSTNFARCEDAVVATALDRIKDGFRKPLSVDDLNRGSGVSRAAFDRRFQAVTGKSPYQMLLQQRFREAERLLIDTSTRITEIAETCGFRTVHDFSARFKDRHGRSPLQFRQAANCLAKER